MLLTCSLLLTFFFWHFVFPIFLLLTFSRHFVFFNFLILLTFSRHFVWRELWLLHPAKELALR